jgi:hypothetical protein
MMSVVTGRTQTVPDADRGLLELDADLGMAGLEAELCLVGGVVMPLVFQGNPASRRPRDLFESPARLAAAESAVADRLGLPASWMRDAVTALVALRGPGGAWYDGRHLRAYGAPATYVLAMECAALHFLPDPDDRQTIEGDIWYLLRFMNLKEPEQAMAVVSSYLGERQRSPDLPDRLARMLGRTSPAS